MEQILPYLAAVIGFLIVHVLNGIKEEITAIKGQLSKLEGDLHSRINVMERRYEDQHVSLDRRVSAIEGRCSVEHGR